MILIVTFGVIIATALGFALGVNLTYLLACAASVITALSIITAAVFVRLNRGMPTLDWKGAPPTVRDRLTSSILAVTREYSAIVAINGSFLIYCLVFVSIGKEGAGLFEDWGKQLLSGLFGALAATSITRTGYVVWRDYDIVVLQKNLIDSAASSERNAQESALAAERLHTMGKIVPQASIKQQGWEG